MQGHGSHYNFCENCQACPEPTLLRTATTPLISFTAASVWPIGLITFPMRTGSQVMIEVAARSGQFPEPLRYPPRSSLLAWLKTIAMRDFRAPTKPAY